MSHFWSQARIFSWERTVSSPKLGCSSNFDNAFFNAERQVVCQFIILWASWVHFTQRRCRWCGTSIAVAWRVHTFEILFFWDTHKRLKAVWARKTNVVKIWVLRSHLEMITFSCLTTTNLKTLVRVPIYQDNGIKFVLKCWWLLSSIWVKLSCLFTTRSRFYIPSYRILEALPELGMQGSIFGTPAICQSRSSRDRIIDSVCLINLTNDCHLRL